MTNDRQINADHKRNKVDRPGKNTYLLNKVERPLSDPAERYLAARVNPFSYVSDGARLLDEFSFPTAVRRIEQKFGITTDANGGVGLVVLPSVSDVSAFTGGNDRTFGGGMTNATTSYYEKAVNGGVLDTVMTAYRIVGWGAKVVWTQNVTTIQGTYTIASLPCLATGTFEPALFNDTTTIDRAEQLYQSLGMPYLGTGLNAYLDTNSLTALPFAVSAQPLCKGEDVFLVSKPTSSASTWFRQSTVRTMGTDAVDATTAQTTNAARDMSYTSKHGWQCFALGINNATPNTTIGEVTLVYHIEGIPKVSVGAIRDSGIQLSPISPHEQYAVDSAAASLPTSATGNVGKMDKIMDFAHRHASALKTGSAIAAGLGGFAATGNPAVAYGTAKMARNIMAAASSQGKIGDGRSRTTQNGLVLYGG